MLWQQFLINPKSLKDMQKARKGVTGVCILGIAVVGFSLWTARKSMGEENSRLIGLQRQVNEVNATLKQKQQAADKAKHIKALPPAAGGAEFLREVNRIAMQAGLDRYGVRFVPGPVVVPAAPNPQNAPANGGGGGQQPPPPQGGAPAPAQGQPQEQAATKIGFECELAGSFQGLSVFLGQLTTLPQIIEIKNADIQRLRADSSANAVRLQMKVSGVLFAPPKASETK